MRSRSQGSLEKTANKVDRGRRKHELKHMERQGVIETADKMIGLFARPRVDLGIMEDR